MDELPSGFCFITILSTCQQNFNFTKLGNLMADSCTYVLSLIHPVICYTMKNMDCIFEIILQIKIMEKL